MADNVVIITSSEERRDLESLVPLELFEMAQKNGQKAIPNIAKDPKMIQVIEAALKRVFTSHQMILGDSRMMDAIPDQSVHLAVTSPPYWTLKEYPPTQGQRDG
jgi:hypothetical protein